MTVTCSLQEGTADRQTLTLAPGVAWVPSASAGQGGSVTSSGSSPGRGAGRGTCSLSSSVHTSVEPVPGQPHTAGLTRCQQQRLGQCPPATDSSPVNARPLHRVWHNLSWLQLAACEYLLSLPQGHAPVHPNHDRSGGEATMASWPVTHID